MFILLLGLWILLTGSVEPGLLAAGAAVSAGLTALFPRSRRKVSLRGALRAAEYGAHLLGQIVLSCAQVTAMVWSGKRPKPRMVRFTPQMQDEAARVLLANSITLTPGTITVEIEQGEFRVHALDAAFAEGLSECGFVRRLEKEEG